MNKLKDLEFADSTLGLLVLGPGCGETILVRVPPDQWVVIDSFERAKLGCIPVLAMKYLGVDHLDAAVLTHPHEDHAPGFDRVVDSCTGKVGCVPYWEDKVTKPWDGESVKDRGKTEQALARVFSRWEGEPDTRWELKAGSQIKVGDALLTVLHPSENALGKETGPNELSAPILMEWKEARLVFGADLPTEFWPDANRSTEVAAHHFLKLPHHGSKEGFHEEVLGGVDQPRDRVWVLTPFKSGMHPPRFEEGEGVARALKYVDEIHLTSALFPTQGERLSRQQLQASQVHIANAEPVGLPGVLTNSYLVVRDPESAWIALSFDGKGRLVEFTSGEAALTTFEEEIG